MREGGKRRGINTDHGKRREGDLLSETKVLIEPRPLLADRRQGAAKTPEEERKNERTKGERRERTETSIEWAVGRRRRRKRRGGGWRMVVSESEDLHLQEHTNNLHQKSGESTSKTRTVRADKRPGGRPAKKKDWLDIPYACRRLFASGAVPGGSWRGEGKNVLSMGCRLWLLSYPPLVSM